MAVGQKKVPQMGCPAKWKHELKPAVPWWFYFDPYPYGPPRVVFPFPSDKKKKKVASSNMHSDLKIIHFERIPGKNGFAFAIWRT